MSPWADQFRSDAAELPGINKSRMANDFSFECRGSHKHDFHQFIEEMFKFVRAQLDCPKSVILVQIHSCCAAPKALSLFRYHNCPTETLTPKGAPPGRRFYTLLHGHVLDS